MKVVTVGIGQCGCNIVDEFFAINAYARSFLHRRIEIVTDAFAINTDEADLTGLRFVPKDKHHRIIIGMMKTFGHGVGKTNADVAMVMKGSYASITDTTSPTTTPASTLRITDIKEIDSNPVYWNLAWRGREAELVQKVREINTEYFTTHTYIKGETVCADMTVDIWNMLQTAGITSIIVAGNLDLDNYTFAQCNHSWLLIFSLEESKSEPSAFALESTNGQLYFAGDTARNPNLKRYWGGFFYTKPSDFRADFKECW